MSERTITLNGFRYEIKRALGTPGLVARAELAEVDYFGEKFEVVLKSAATAHQSEKLKGQLETESAVLKKLSKVQYRIYLRTMR